jgi:hypothetical protein
MFEYIKLHNFKSFGDIEFDLRGKKDNPKHLALVYGENGIGKSNLACAFFMLAETCRTMDVRDFLQALLSKDPKTFEDEDFLRIIKGQFKDIETLIKENKTVGTTKNMYLEFGFKVNGKGGKYIIETDNTQIVHERLEYTLIKNRGIYFNITPDNMTINEKIFKDNIIIPDIKDAGKKFWGKHSMLSIIDHELKDKADNYFRDQLSKNFSSLMKFLFSISCRVKFCNKEQGLIGLPENIFRDYEEGTINLEKEKILDNTEKMLNDFFSKTHHKIKKVYYKRNYENDSINYRLIVKKIIAGKEREIDFSLESTGTQSLLQLLPFLLVAIRGATVIIDEFDIGIHDLLIQKLVESVNKHLKGQLIITTHNTLLMESDLPKESMYVIIEKDDGTKMIQNITKIDSKIHTKTNIRNQYIHGKYYGVPEVKDIDFDLLIEDLK